VGHAKKEIEEAVEGWLLKARLLTTQFRFDEAEKAYLDAIDAAPESFKAKFAYSLFSQDLNRFEKARAAYGRCLEWARKKGNDADVALTLKNLGLLDRDQGRMEEARNELAEALKIRRKLAQKNPETYQPDVTQTLNNLGVLDRDQGRMEEARSEFAEALDIYGSLAAKNPDELYVEPMYSRPDRHIRSNRLKKVFRKNGVS
jgi:tetratricopeptide (TPR) repeat protein